MKRKITGIYPMLCIATLVTALSTVSCVKDNDKGDKLTLSTGSSLVFGSLEGADTTIFVSVTCLQEWTLESKPDWITVSPEASSGSPMLIKITASRNEGIDTRSGELIFRLSGGSMFAISCHQLSTVGSLAIDDPTNYSLSYEQRTISVRFFSNLKNMVATVVPDDQSWISATIEQVSQPFDFALMFTVQENKTGLNRSAKVAISGESGEDVISDTIYIDQKYYMEVLSATLVNNSTGFSFSWAQSSMPQVAYYNLEILEDRATPVLLASYNVSGKTSCLIDTMAFMRSNNYLGNMILRVSGMTAPGVEVILAQTDDNDVNSKTNSHFAGGAGTTGNPYLLNCVRHFNNIMLLFNTGANDPRGMMNFSYKQTADITFPAPTSPGAIGSNLSPIGTRTRPFIGLYDGDGYKLNNVYIISSERYVGVFVQLGVNDTPAPIATIRNLHVRVNYIEGRATTNYGSDVQAAAIGGIVGMNGGTIENCTVDKYGADGAIYGNNRNATTATELALYIGYTGGIAGANERNIISCVNIGCPVVSKGPAGGIAGGTANVQQVWHVNNGVYAIRSCYNLAPVYQGNPGAGVTLPMGIDIPGDEAAVPGEIVAGGIIGSALGANNGLRCNISFCFNGGDVYSENFAAGIVGRIHFGPISKCFNYGKIVAVRNGAANTSSKYAGGILGQANNNNNSTTTCYNVGLITYYSESGSAANMFLGGCVGQKGANTTNNAITDLVYVNQASPVLAGVTGANGGATGIVNCISLSDAAIKVLSNYPASFTATDWTVLPSGYAYPRLIATPMP